MSQSPREQANAAIKKFLARRDWSAESPARRRTLAAFLRLATEHGFESVSMRTLGHELGLKAPSLYSSFPHGKDEIVAESLRWFTYRFAHDLLDVALPSRSPEEYWEVLVRFHFAQQLRRPEADLWNFLVARDKVAPFLDPDAREEAYSWLELHERMYGAAAEEMGRSITAEGIKAVFTVLDGAQRWSAWNGTEAELERLSDHAVELTRSILDVGSREPVLGRMVAAAAH
ncbi:AcrR family transcriptional regulator [Arthrobacter sp. NicSoilE8]|nr:AcrR family transcriptional regulator [Arthrobacter sp. NicSoilE8]